MCARSTRRSTWSTATSEPKRLVSWCASMAYSGARAGALPASVTAVSENRHFDRNAGGQLASPRVCDFDLREKGEPAAVALRERVVRSESRFASHPPYEARKRLVDSVHGDLRTQARPHVCALRLRHVNAG